TLGVPALVSSQPKELVIGGAASHKAFMEPTVIPMFEKKHNCKIVFEGTKSLVNLEKMVSNKAKPYLSVVMMDDPVLILAAKEDVIEKLVPAKVPNLTKLKRKSAPIDMAAPKEGVMSMPSGIAKVKNGPQPELAYTFIDEMLGVEFQKILAEAAAAVPTNTAAPMPAGMPKVEVFVPDWA